MAHTTTTGGGKIAVLLTVVVVKTVRTDSLPVEKAFLSCGVICLQNSTTSATVIERRWRRVRGRGGGGGGGGGGGVSWTGSAGIRLEVAACCCCRRLPQLALLHQLIRRRAVLVAVRQRAELRPGVGTGAKLLLLLLLK